WRQQAGPKQKRARVAAGSKVPGRNYSAPGIDEGNVTAALAISPWCSQLLLGAIPHPAGLMPEATFAFEGRFGSGPYSGSLAPFEFGDGPFWNGSKVSPA